MDRGKSSDRGVVAGRSGTLYCLPVETHDGPIERYVTDSEAVDIERESVDRALALAGAWSRMDWDEVESELDRIRHSSPPSEPVDLTYLECDEHDR